MRTITIDRTNYLKLHVQKGDIVLARDGRDLGVVLRLDHLKRIIWEGYYGVVVKTEGTWDQAFERGTRLKRVIDEPSDVSEQAKGLTQETIDLVRQCRTLIVWVDDGDDDWVGLTERIECLAEALKPFEEVQS